MKDDVRQNSSFLSRTSQPVTNTQRKHEQSQAFITNPISPYKKIIAFVPEQQIQVKETKQHYLSLQESINQMKMAIQKVRCEYRQVNRKIKQSSIQQQAQIKKIQSIFDIDFKFLKKNMQNTPEISFNFVTSQLQQQQKQQNQAIGLINKLHQKLVKVQTQIG